MVNLPVALTPHTVTCRDYLGAGTGGAVLADPRTIHRCKVEDRRTLIKTETGATVVGQSVVYIRPEFGPIPLRSELRVWQGTPAERTGQVLSVEFLHMPPGPTHYKVVVS